MRVEDHTLTDIASSTAARANEAQRIQVDSATSSASGAVASGDRVDLSSLTGRIAQAMQALSGQSAQRAGQLQKDFQAGRYQPDSQQLATALTAF